MIKTAEEIYNKRTKKYPIEKSDWIKMMEEYASQFQFKAEGVSDEEIEKESEEYLKDFPEDLNPNPSDIFFDGAKWMRDRMPSQLAEKEEALETLRNDLKLSFSVRDENIKRFGGIINDLQSELEAVKDSHTRLEIKYQELKSQAEKMAEALKLADTLLTGTWTEYGMSNKTDMWQKKQITEALSHYKLTVPTDIKK